MNNYIQILVWLLTFHLVLGRAKGKEKHYDGVLRTLKYTEKLLFDITKPLNAELKNNSTSKYLIEEGLDKLEVRLSPLLYVGTDGIRYNDTGFFHSNGDHKRFLISHVWENETVSVYFLCRNDHHFNVSLLPLTLEEIQRTLLHLETTSNKDDNFTIIFNVRDWNNYIKNWWAAERLKKLIADFKTKWTNVKVGLEYNYYDNRDTYYNVRLIIPLVDILILNVDIPPEEFILSYTDFKSNLRKILDQNHDFVQIGLSNCTTYAKLNFPGQFKEEKRSYLTRLLFETYFYYDELEMPDKELHNKYYYYLLQFSVFWVNDGESEGIILSAFNNSLAFEDGLDGTPLMNLAAIPVSSNILDIGACGLKAVLDHSLSNSKTISVGNGFMNYFREADQCVLINSPSCHPNKTESKACNRPNGLLTIPDINLKYNANIGSPEDSKIDLLHNVRTLSSRNMSWNLIEIKTYTGGWHGDRIANELEELIQEIPSGVKIACDSRYNFVSYNPNFSQNYSKIIQGANEECKYIWNSSSIIIWNIKPDTKDVHTLTKRLEAVELQRQLFLQQFPDKSIIIRFNLERGSYTENIEEDIFGLYCLPEVLFYNKQAELLLNYARIHNMQFELEDVMGYFDDFHGGWRVIKTVPEIDIRKTKFPVFVARDYPNNFLLGEFPTDPCISWTKEVPLNGLDIHNEYSGTSLYMAGFRENDLLTQNELQMLLRFSFHKFSLVEIIPGSISDVDILLDVLSDEKFLLKLNTDGSKPIQLYLRFDADVLTKLNTIEKLANLTLRPAGIHFVNWNNSESFSEAHVKNLKESGIMVGISLEQCLNEANDGYSNLRSSPLFKEADYLVCNMNQLTEATNINIEHISKFLDTTLYIQKYFQRMFPNATKEIMFRMNPVPSKSSIGAQVVNVHETVERVVRDETSNFLTFISDVNQYGNLYKMKFFMLPTFDDSLGERFGWWKITNFESLTNISVFIEKEAEHLGQESWHPNEDINPPTTLTWIIILSVVVLTLLIISSAFFLRMWYRSQFVLLTKKEVVEFQYGTLEDASDEKKTFDNLNFPEEYQISKGKIVLINMIGKGNFGLVYKATCSHGDESDKVVAVKIPHPNCTRDSFKSMLSELKILCYVGYHPHVLGFVGAYIKEIGRGTVKIVTTLCENGALQEHLRKLHTQLVQGELKNLKPNLYELCRFSQEIALGMEYIERKKIVHGDLSTRNVLLDSDFQCKISDFGLSRKLYEYQEYIKKSTEPLPWRWLAIESLKRMEFTSKSDCWSYGITLWEIFSLGSVPYSGLAWTEEFLSNLEDGYRMSTPAFSTSEIYGEMKRCWEINPMSRPAFTELSEFFGTMRNSEYVQVARG